MSAPTRIAVGSGATAYDVVVGSGLDHELPAVLGGSVRQVLVVHPVAQTAAGPRVRDGLQRSGFAVQMAEPTALKMRRRRLPFMVYAVGSAAIDALSPC